jgi:opacity protein-like surface antigen
MPGTPAPRRFQFENLRAAVRLGRTKEMTDRMLLRGFLQNWISKAGLCLMVASSLCATARAQDVPDTFSNRRVFSGFVEYSNDSSHMLLGYADGRKISAVGASMERRSFLSNHLSGAWLAEVRPFMSVSDPTMKGFTLDFPQQPSYSGIVTFSSAVPVDKPVTNAPLNVILVTQNHIYAGTATYIAGTRSTFVSGISPLGYKLKAFPHRRMQPFVTGLGGFAVSPRDIPVFNSSAFNFTFEFGAGVEVFQTHTRSVQLEYRYHHLGNTGNGSENPGVDSGVFKATYSFGR